ncbi:PilW family protein [Dyella halodurans]|uniref:PilW family protein n=1 Tax=Dyella halodurans TaxID=1920171 RepID=A0ABV9C459_9GAMM|nr:PilW family protein [Dyella halodurans]
MTSPRLRVHQAGVTLVELMIAMVLGLLVSGGIITVFLTTSHSNRVQNQLARLQEEGRYAIGRLVGDLRMANGHYCTNTGGLANQTSSGVLLDGLRSPMVYANNLVGAMSDVTTNWGASPYPAKPTSPYYFPSFLAMRGYDCTRTSCTPVVSKVPNMGTNVDSRVVGSSVLTLRYLDSSKGWALGGANSTVTTDADGTVAAIDLKQGRGEPPVTDFESGDLAMLANCSSAAIFAVDGGGARISPAAVSTALDGNTGKPVALQPQSAPRLFDFKKDFLTVTYYLKVVANDDGSTTGALIRRVNGKDSEMVRGVERLDFLYGVEDSNGNTSYLTAAQVDGGTNCPPSVPVKLGNDPGCLWRGVKSIEVRILMSGQQALPTLAASDTRYTYASDGITEPKPPADAGRSVTPAQQGFDDRMLRREFSALVALRNYNP